MSIQDFIALERRMVSNVKPSLDMLNSVTPKKTLIVESQPCELTCADIRNQTVEAMKKFELAADYYLDEVAYRMLQSRQGMRCTRNEAIFFGFLPPFGVFSMIPNIGNATRYRKTFKHAEQFLTKYLGEEAVKTIKAFRFDQEGIQKLSQFLTAKGIPVHNLETRADKKYFKSIFATGC